MKYILLISLFFSVCLASCYYDSEENLYPQLSTSCDTSNITYSTSVATILTNNCLGCHANNIAASSGGNIRLGTYNDVKEHALAGHLYGSIAHLSGYSPMPKGGGKLDNCKLTIIKKWIDAGAPNN